MRVGPHLDPPKLFNMLVHMIRFNPGKTRKMAAERLIRELLQTPHVSDDGKGMKLHFLGSLDKRLGEIVEAEGFDFEYELGLQRFEGWKHCANGQTLTDRTLLTLMWSTFYLARHRITLCNLTKKCICSIIIFFPA
jgi:hypothetical protein